MTSTAIGYWAIGGYVPQYEGVGKIWENMLTAF